MKAICGGSGLPVAIKLTPYLSSIGHFAVTLVEHGAAGLVLFNRLMEPDIDLLQMKLTDTLELSEFCGIAVAVAMDRDARRPHRWVLGNIDRRTDR